MSKVYHTRTYAARRCDRCPRTMRNLAKAGKGPPFIMIGNRPAYPDDLLEAWLAAGGDA